jgi:hypothetical protein
MVDLQADRESKSEFQHIGEPNLHPEKRKWGCHVMTRFGSFSEHTQLNVNKHSTHVTFLFLLFSLLSFNRRDDHEKNLKDATDLASL